MKRAIYTISALILVSTAFFLIQGGKQFSREETSPKSESNQHSQSANQSKNDHKTPIESRLERATQKEHKRTYTDLDLLPANELGKQDNTETDDIHHVISLVLQYDSIMKEGSIPTGMNEDFVDALTGKNTHSFRFIKRSHPRIDPQGRLTDSWGSPYFFHSVSSQEFSIRSAGPDREFYTDDDIHRTTQ